MTTETRIEIRGATLPVAAPVPVRVINAESARERRRRVSGQLNDAQRYRVSIIVAIDGRELSHQQLSRAYMPWESLHRSGRYFTAAEIGCALSHLRAYEHLLESNDSWSLILEDDALLAPSLVSVLRAGARWLDDAKPRVLLMTPLRAFAPRRGEAITNGTRRVHVIRAWDGAGYAINRAAAAELLRVNDPVVLMADDWVGFRRRARLEICGVDPYLIEQDNSLASSLESTRKANRRQKARTLRYVAGRFLQNTGNALGSTLWWKLTSGYRVHTPNDRCRDLEDVVVRSREQAPTSATPADSAMDSPA